MIIVVVGIVVVGIVVTIRITVVVIRIRAVVWQVIPRVESVPEAVDKDKDMTVVKMCTPPVPVVVPICVMTRKRVIRV